MTPEFTQSSQAIDSRQFILEFDALMGGNFSRERPIDGEYDVNIHTDLVDKTRGELFLMEPGIYQSLQRRGDDFKRRRPHHNEEIMWDTGQYGHSDIRTYDSLYRSQLVGPHCALNVLFAVYWDAVAATVQLTFMSKQDVHLNKSVAVVRVDIWGKVTARNNVLTDPEAFSTLFARTSFDRTSLVPGDSLPMSRPSVVVPSTSSLSLDLDLKYHVKVGTIAIITF